VVISGTTEAKPNASILLLGMLLLSLRLVRRSFSPLWCNHIKKNSCAIDNDDDDDDDNDDINDIMMMIWWWYDGIDADIMILTIPRSSRSLKQKADRTSNINSNINNNNGSSSGSGSSTSVSSFNVYSR